MSTTDRLAEIRARAAAARQAAASGTTGLPPNVDGLSISDALDIFAESAEDVPWILDRLDRAEAKVEALIEQARAGEVNGHRLTKTNETVTAERDRAEATLARVREALANHPHCEAYDGPDPIACGWKRAVLDVQDAIEVTAS